MRDPFGGPGGDVPSLAAASRSCSRARISSGVYDARRRSERATTTPVAATPASPASPTHFATLHQRTALGYAAVATTGIELDAAVDLTRTGDLWLFRGRSVADRAIRTATNAPVNHVGMAVTIGDLPPLMWHAELGRSLQDLWSGEFRRGVQLHDLRAAVEVWGERYGQRAWLRQLELPDTPDRPAIEAAMEDAALRTVARLSGTPFPSTARLAGRWLRGRTARWTGRTAPWTGRKAPWTGLTARWTGGTGRLFRGAPPSDVTTPSDGRGTSPAARERPGDPSQDSRAALETAYCAEVVAATYQAMGLLPATTAVNWYDPGRFWSGDDLDLLRGARLGAEIAVHLPAAPRDPVRPGR